MAVAFDAQSTADSTANSVTSINHTNLTVGSGTNRALVVAVIWGGGTVPTSITVTWDNGGTNQACSLISGASSMVTNRCVQLYGLVNPISGNKTLRVAWTNANDVYVAAAAFTDVLQTGGASTFANGAAATGTGTTASRSVTTAVGDYVMAAFVAANTIASVNNTQVFIDNVGATNSGASNRVAGSGSNPTMSATLTSAAWGAVGCNIKQAVSSQSITGALVTDADTFYGATITTGSVDIGGALYADADVFYAATIGRGAVDIGGALVADGDTFYVATVSQAGASQDITGALVTDADTFYGSTVAATYSIAGALYSDADTFFGATISATVGITGSLVTDPDTFFAASIVADGTPQAITGALYANDNTFFGANVGGNVVPLPITPGGGNVGRRKWRHWEEDEEAEVRKLAKAKVVAAIQSGLLVELTRAGVKAYTAQTVERLVPEISDEALNEITARITASLHRVIAQQRQEDDDEEALLLSA